MGEGQPAIAVTPADDLAAAVAAAPAGAVLALGPGEHRLARPTAVTRPLTLTGAGAALTRVACPADDHGLRFEADGLLAIDGIAFVADGPGRGEGFRALVDVVAGEVRLTSCRFEGAPRDLVDDAGGHGLRLGGASRGTVSRCEFRDNGNGGAVAAGGSTVVLEECEATGNGRSGFALVDRARPTLRGCRSEANGYHGYFVGGRAEPVFDRCVAADNAYHGFSWHDQAAGVARACHATGNGVSGVDLDQLAAPLLEGNVLAGNMGMGLYYQGLTAGRAVGNRCDDNRQSGIGVVGGAAPVLEENRCEANGISGLFYHGLQGGRARGNALVANALQGVYVGARSVPTLEANVIERNEVDGLTYDDMAAGLARENQCRGNLGAGILCRGQARPALEANVAAENGGSGLHYMSDAGGTASGNELRANGYNGILVAGRARPVLESNVATANEAWGLMYDEVAKGEARHNVCDANQKGEIRVGRWCRPELSANDGEVERPEDEGQAADEPFGVDDDEDEDLSLLPRALREAPVQLALGGPLLDFDDDGVAVRVTRRMMDLRLALARRLGFAVPHVAITGLPAGAPEAYVVSVHGEAVATGEAWADRFLALPGPGATAAAIAGVPGLDPRTGRPAVWIQAADRADAEARGCEVLAPDDVILRHVEEVVLAFAPEVLGVEQVAELLDSDRDAAKAALGAFAPTREDVARLLRVMRLLLAERVPLRDVGAILAAVVAHDASLDAAALVERVRADLAFTISAACADENQAIDVVTMAPAMRDRLVSALGADGKARLPEAERQALVDALAIAVADATARGFRPALLVDAEGAPGLRAAVRALVAHELPATPVLATHEVHPRYRVREVARA